MVYRLLGLLVDFCMLLRLSNVLPVQLLLFWWPADSEWLYISLFAENIYRVILGLSCLLNFSGWSNLVDYLSESWMLMDWISVIVF